MPRSNIALVAATAVVTALLTTTMPAVARAGYDAINSDKVDGKHAVGAGASGKLRRGRLVATSPRTGRLPNDIIAKAPDANRLDGLDSTAFLPRNGKASDAARLGGVGADGYVKTSQRLMVHDRTTTAQSVPGDGPVTPHSDLRVDVTAPTEGTVVVTGVITLDVEHHEGQKTVIRVGPVRRPDIGPYQPGSGYLTLASTTPSDVTTHTLPFHAAFDVQSGSVPIFVTARAWNAARVNMWQGTITATFYPKSG